MLCKYCTFIKTMFFTKRNLLAILVLSTALSTKSYSKHPTTVSKYADKHICFTTARRQDIVLASTAQILVENATHRLGMTGVTSDLGQLTQKLLYFVQIICANF